MHKVYNSVQIKCHWLLNSIMDRRKIRLSGLGGKRNGLSGMDNNNYGRFHRYGNT
jgi:hypothetical protein